MAHDRPVYIPGHLKGLAWLVATQDIDVDSQHAAGGVAARGQVALLEQAHRSEARGRFCIADVLEHHAVAVQAAHVVCLQRRPHRAQGPVSEGLRMLDLESAIVEKYVDTSISAART